MTHDPRPDTPADAHRADPPSARRFCPRCGAVLGVLAASGGRGAADGGRERAEPAADALYCGCCGLVVPAA